MSPTLARTVILATLVMACARTESPEPEPPEPPPPPPPVVAQIDATQVCDRMWALFSAEATTPVNAVDFEAELQRCVAAVEDGRRAVGEDEFQRQATCVLAAGSVAELRACDPNSGPPPSPREPAQFPEGALARPLSEVMDNAVYTPNPDPKDLQQTKAARFDKADGVSTVAFCIEPDGTTAHVHTVQQFPGDPMIDQIIRDTIAKWRFKPWIVDGVAVEVCTEKRFKLKFK